MKIDRVIIEGIELLDICECFIYKEVNQHSKAVISGHISDPLEEQYFRKSLTEEWAVLNGVTTTGDKVQMFGGYIKDFSILKVNGQKAIRLSLVSGTMLMDLHRKRLTYQDLSETYVNIVNEIVERYTNGMIIASDRLAVPIGSMKVQYEETDWEFVKRLASCQEQIIVPHARRESVTFDFGLNEAVVENTILDILEEAKQKEKSGFSYKVKTREFYEIGSKILYHGGSFFVYAASSFYEKQEVVNEYILKNSHDFSSKQCFNDKIIGASLEAIVTSIERDEVKVQVMGESGVKQKLFPYATVYSSPDGTGWYCMPEYGDRVRIYFPTNEEHDAYVINSTHLPVETSGSGITEARVNPNHKSIKNKDGKEILMTPDKILITNNKGMAIEINDAEGISIVSNKKIIMESQEGIDMISKGKGLNIIADEQISLIQSGSSINLKDDVVITGGKIKNV